MPPAEKKGSFANIEGVPVRALLEHERMESISSLAGGTDLTRLLTHPRIQKPGLVLAGHSHGMHTGRVQVFGETEMSYLESLPPELRRTRAEGLFALGLSCVVVSRGARPPSDFLHFADKTDTPLILSTPRSSVTITAIHGALDELLAPRKQIHGVMVEVHGIGILLVGPSGIGKSECALFLVERGHRFVADDQVHLTQLSNGQVSAAPAPLLQHHLEIRGLGILNIRELFGTTAVWSNAVVDLLVELCPWREGEQYDRLGLDEHTEDILGTPIPKLRVPVRPGRNMAVILEVAARNALLKEAGHHAAKDFARRLSGKLGLVTDH